MSYRSIGQNRFLLRMVSRMRKQRFKVLRALLGDGSAPTNVLDVGGTQQYWQLVTEGWPTEHLRITLLNVAAYPVTLPHFATRAGDGRAMPEFADRQFDVVFSNSVIEHVGTFEDQQRMASEVRRIGRRYCIQTPNRYFPIEAHYIFPLFQFLPISVRVWLVLRLRLGWYGVRPTYDQVFDDVSSIRLLSRRELRRLFPEATIIDERWCGLTKSLIAFGEGSTGIDA